MSLSLSPSLKADALFKLLSPLVKDQADQPVEPPDPDDFEEEQGMMARLVHLFQAPEPDQQYMVSHCTVAMEVIHCTYYTRNVFWCTVIMCKVLFCQILNVARKHFGTGGDLRISYTLPPLVFAAYKLITEYHSLKEKVRNTDSV